MTHRGPFQPQIFCDSVNKQKLHFHANILRKLLQGKQQHITFCSVLLTKSSLQGILATREKDGGFLSCSHESRFCTFLPLKKKLKSFLKKPLVSSNREFSASISTRRFFCIQGKKICIHNLSTPQIYSSFWRTTTRHFILRCTW